MRKLLSSRTLLALLLVAPMLGCVAKPPERPIVLRPPHRLAHRPPRPTPSEAADKGGTAPASAISGTPAAEPGETLSPAEKEALFRDFDQYLLQSGRSP